MYAVCQLLEDEPYTYSDEIQDFLIDNFDMKVSLTTISHTLQRMCLSCKKVFFVPYRRCSPDGRQQVAVFVYLVAWHNIALCLQAFERHGEHELSRYNARGYFGPKIDDGNG